MPWLNIDFYSALDKSKKKRIALGAILKEIGDLPPHKRLLLRGPEYADYIELRHVSANQIFGGAARIRRMGLPSRFNLRTIQRRDLGFDPDEGLEEIAYFIFDDELETLALQRHRLFRSGSFERLVREIGDVQFHLEPKMRKDQWSRFKRLDRIGSLEITLFGPDHHPDFSDVQPSLGKLLDDSAGQANAMRVELRLSMAQVRSQSLNRDWVQAIVSKLRREENVETLKVSGRQLDDGDSDEINFLRDRLAFSQEVEYSSRSLEEDECRRVLRRAIDTNREYLNSLL